MITRFAPSPTGYLHLGHAYSALYAYDLAVANDGEFILRHEDIDSTRVREEYYGAIERDLSALGITWKATPLRQLDRLAFYMEALEELKSLGVIYPCFCTRKEIREEVAGMGNAPHGPEGALYPGTCRKLSAEEARSRVIAGDGHCWRLDAQKAASLAGALSFSDHFYGTVTVDPCLLGDVVLARKDISTSYHLAVIVDDAHQGITHVTRGSDLLAATHIHRVLQKLLKIPEPLYHHHPLILDRQGQRLAKRAPGATLRELLDSGRNHGEIAAEVRNLLK